MKNSVATLTHFMRELNVPVMPETIEQELTQHPDFLSLFSLSDLLNRWKIPNISCKVDAEDLGRIACPFIAVSNKEEFVVVNDYDQKKVIVSNEKWQKHTLDFNDFYELYGGIILVAEPNEDSGEEGYLSKRRQKFIDNLRNPVALLFLLTILGIVLEMRSSYASIFNWQILLLVLLKGAGVVTSIFLLTHTIDANNPVVQRVCSSVKSNCNSILSSRAAKISNEISWSEAGFFYFTGTWLIVLFNSGSVAVMQSLAILNLLSLPYTFYSFYYQSRVARQWCVFCCVVITLFWLEFFTFLPFLLQPLRITGATAWASIAVGMSAPVIFWIFVKPYLVKSAQLKPAVQQLNSFKYHPAVMSALLNGQEAHPLLRDEHTIMLGNPSAKHVVTLAFNPFCNPCAQAHRMLDNWLETNDNVKIQLVFHANTDMNAVWQLAKDWMILKHTHGDTYLKEPIADWFAQKQFNYAKWREANPVVGEETTARSSIAVQKQWCTVTGVRSTPTVFINGRKLPPMYAVSDVRYFIW